MTPEPADIEASARWARQALAYHASGQLDDAERAARAALRHSPDSATPRHVLGLVHHDRNHLAAAEDSFRAAVRLDPDAAGSWINLGLVRQKLGDLAEAEAAYLSALRAGAAIGAVGGNLGLALLEQGRPEAAEQACRLALMDDPANADARLNLAFVLLLTGRYQEGWDAYEARLRPEPGPAPLCDLAQAAGRTVLVRAEQGFGDTLQFCRYAPLLAGRGARVVLAVPPPLVRLLRGLDGVTAVIAMDETPPGIDFQVRLMSLPRLFGTTVTSVPGAVPYLHADPDRIAWWAGQLAALPGPRIGVVWAGGRRLENPHAAAVDRRRSIPLAALAPLAEVAGCTFVSLCPDHAQAADWLHTPPGALTDFAETAALLMNLDLVITVDTAVAHLAGALGRRVWLLNRHDSCWRWLLGRTDSPWYPTLRIFRQPEAGDWAPVVAAVRAALWDQMPAVSTAATSSSRSITSGS